MSFPEAPDFQPGSRRWLRDVEKRLLAAEAKADRAEKNLASYKKSQAAGSRAVNKRLTDGIGLSQGPSAPERIAAVPYAYFTASGYPAAGIRVSWGGMDPTTHRVEVWTERTDGTGNESVMSAEGWEADVRGLEVLTSYTVIVRGVSKTGTPGNYSEPLNVNTPNELTMIGQPTDPILAGASSAARVTWDGLMAFSSGLTYLDTGEDLMGPGYNFAPGVAAPNGKIYFPESMESGSHLVLVVDPATQEASLVNMGSGSTENWGAGMLGQDGLIYFGLVAGYSDSSTELLVINPETNTATVENVAAGPFTSAMSSLMHSNGKMYFFHTHDFGDGPLASVIDPATMTGYTVELVSGADFQWTPGPAVEADDGRIIIARGRQTGNLGRSILIFNPDDDSFTYGDYGVGTAAFAQYYALGAKADGKIYFVPAVYTTNDATRPMLVFNPASDTAYYGPNVPRATSPYNEPTGVAVVAKDGKIHYWGRTPGAETTGVLVHYDPAGDTVEYEALGLGEDGYVTAYSAMAVSNDGVVYAAPANDGSFSGEGYSDRLLKYDPDDASNDPNPPRYLKYILVERRIGSTWTPVGTIAAPGSFADIGLASGTHDYRFIPVSTAGTRGQPSSTVSVTAL